MLENHSNVIQILSLILVTILHLIVVFKLSSLISNKLLKFVVLAIWSALVTAFYTINLKFYN